MNLHYSLFDVPPVDLLASHISDRTKNQVLDETGVVKFAFIVAAVLHDVGQTACFQFNVVVFSACLEECKCHSLGVVAVYGFESCIEAVPVLSNLS